MTHETYLPWWTGDSPGYTGPAALMYHGEWSSYDGGRTPSYPLFLLGCQWLAGGDLQIKPTPWAGQMITWAQTILGLAAVALVYLSMERWGIRPWVRFALTLACALTAVLARFEMILLSESLCLFFIVLSVYGMTLATGPLQENRARLFGALLAGTASGLALLTRPNVMFIWLPWISLLLLFSGWAWAESRRAVATALLKISGIGAGSGALLVAGWLVFNYENNSNFELTPITEFTRTTTAYNLFDRVHPQDKLLGEIMTRYYRKTNPPGTLKPDYIWMALPELMNRYGELPVHAPHDRLAIIHLARYLGRVSDYLLWENPGVWWQNSWAGFRRTGDFYLGIPPPDYVGDDPISLDGKRVVVSARGWAVLDRLERAEAWPLFIAYSLTFAALPVSCIRAFHRRGSREPGPDFLIFVLSGGSLLTLVAPCILATYSNRYSLPMIPVFMICAAYVMEVALRWRTDSPEARIRGSGA